MYAPRFFGSKRETIRRQSLRHPTTLSSEPNEILPESTETTVANLVKQDEGPSTEGLLINLLSAMNSVNAQHVNLLRELLIELRVLATSSVNSNMQVTT